MMDVPEKSDSCHRYRYKSAISDSTQQCDKKLTQFNVSHVASYKFYNQASGYNGISGTVPVLELPF